MIGDKKFIGKLKGFTLVEVLAALAVFSIVLAIVVNFSLSFYRTQRRTENTQELSYLGRSIMERLAQEARENEIDYSAYDNESADFPATALYFKDQEDQPIIFKKFDDEADCPEGAAPCLKISNDGINWSSLTNKNVKLKDLRFYLWPRTDPFKFNQDTLSYSAPEQPYLTIALSLERARPNLWSSLESITLQTSLSSRIYKK